MDVRTFFLMQYDVVRMLADELMLAELNDEQLLYAPGKDQRSLAWLLWHTTRWEDLAMTMVEHDAPQILYQKGWATRLGIARCDLGVQMTAQEHSTFNDTVNLPAVRAYRRDVEQRNQMVVEALLSEDLDELVQETRFRQVVEAGSIGSINTPWLERFLMHRSRAWWLSSVIWHQAAHLLGEAPWLRRRANVLLSITPIGKS
jgi:hypothetical protein